MIDDNELQAMTPHERSILVRRLVALSESLPIETPEGRRRRRILLDVLVICCLGIVPWIVLLAVTLPRHYVASHWSAAWVGFDVLLFAGLAITSWSIWKRRQMAILASIVTATMLAIDAWFDILTAHTTRDLVMSVGTALIAELPLSALLFFVALRLVQLTYRRARRLVGIESVDLPFWKIPLFVIDEGASEPSSEAP